MTTYLIAAGAIVLVGWVGSVVIDRWQERRLLAQLDEPGTDVEPLTLPAVSTLPETDPDGWSARSGFNPWRAWMDCRHAAVFTAEPSIFNGLAELYLNPRRELPAAPKRRTRRTKTQEVAA